MEDYLEIIYRLGSERGTVRACDIASSLGVKMPSVSGALRTLAARGLVNYRPYEEVSLTRSGFDAARGVDRRHRVLLGFLHEVLGVDRRTAETDACRLEHILSTPSMNRLTMFMDDRPGEEGKRP